jgi:hypothetical protein
MPKNARSSVKPPRRVDDLPAAEQEITPEEAEQVTGGRTARGGLTSAVREDPTAELIVTAGPGPGGHV